MKEIGLTATYFHPLFKRMIRDEVRTKFIEILERELNTSFAEKKEEVSVLLECLIVISTTDTEKHDMISSVLRDLKPLLNFWKKEISILSIKFSSERFLSENALEIISQMLVGMQNASKTFINFFAELQACMSIAEYRGFDYHEPSIPCPPGVIATSERRMFFESVVPPNAKWKI